MGLVSEQSIYNLAKREVELEVIPPCEDYGLGLIPWSPLHGGMLGGVIRKEKEGKRRLTGRSAEMLENRRDQVEAFEKFCADVGEEPADVALAWLLHRPAVIAPIIGPRTMEQLEGSQRALEISLEDDQMTRLDEIWPGHKPAPKDYAW
jgi:aryl-alcohol dehydrogenase-like predicted oxidoreductase